MVKHTVRNHDVERVLAKRRPKQVHLQECDVANRVTVGKTFCQTQRVKTKIASENVALPRHAEEIAQLPGAATCFQDERAFGELLVEKRCEHAAPRFVGEAFA